MTKTERKKLEDALDHEFRWAVRERDGWKCQVCGRLYIPPTTALQCSHFWGCAERHTRWDLENASAHCGGCHMRFTQNPGDHTDWKKARMTEEAYDALSLRAHTSKKWTLDELEDLIESLQQYRAKLPAMKKRRRGPGFKNPVVRKLATERSRHVVGRLVPHRHDRVNLRGERVYQGKRDD